ncbi:hypothetical protein ACOMHN_046854 [Nucella lapillus]
MAGKKNVSLQEKEKLISIIKEQPAVYDATLPEYKDAQFQENIWLSVAEAMGRDDISVCMRRDQCGAMAALAGREHIRTTSPLYTVHDEAFFSPEPDAVAVAGAGAAPQP